VDEELEAEIARLEATRATLLDAQAARLASALAAPRAELEAVEARAALLRQHTADVTRATTVLEAQLAEVGPVPWLGLALFFAAGAAAGGVKVAAVTAVGSVVAWAVGRFVHGRER
jgi:hypothetical protein